jgi:hypothetical protein
MKTKLIETTIGQCHPTDRFHLSDSAMERTMWAISGHDLFGNVIIRCVDGSYPRREVAPETKVFRRQRLVELFADSL